MIDTNRVNQLKKQYANLPDELKLMNRWCGYKIQDIVDKTTGETRTAKLPFNAVTGRFAKSNDSDTWTDFETAINGIVIYGFDGLGIMLGDGITGIDLDNHADPKTGEYPMTEEQFENWGFEAVDFMASYAEWSPSGKGIHILCHGEMPEGKNRNSKVVDGLRRDVEMYGYKRFFTVTGNTIMKSGFEDRTDRIREFWEKYVDDSSERASNGPAYVPTMVSNLSDREIIDKAASAKNGASFMALYNGNMAAYDNNQSRADLALCDKLAYWCNGDASQIDRIFRTSALMRDKWDRPLKNGTYGSITIDEAIRHMTSGYSPVPAYYDAFSVRDSIVDEQVGTGNEMSVDDDGNPIFRIPERTNKVYSMDDVGNAERFYDMFGSLFHYNKASKVFMFWTGKTWSADNMDIIDKYVVRMTQEMAKEAEPYIKTVEEAIASGDKAKIKIASETLKNFNSNLKYVRSAKGIKAVKEVFSSMGKVPVMPSMFNTKEYLLNTESGIVDMRDGTVMDFDKNEMLSLNTHCGVSYDTPTVWLNFLKQVFRRGDGETEKEKKETGEIIDVVQQILGLALTGYTREQRLFILYGNGSNGKSVFINFISNNVMGDYASKVDSSVFLAKDAGTNSNVMYALSSLVGKRLVITSETDDGERLSEKSVKDITGNDMVSVREIYGKFFSYLPQYNVFMCTNNLPIIRGTDHGIWRRIFVIPFVQTFEGANKDPDMPRKLDKEKEKILGWCIRGYQKYIDNGASLTMPDCIKDTVEAYKEDMDVVSRFLNKCCRVDPLMKELCYDVYKAYKFWARDNTDYQMKENNFYKNLKSKGFNVVKNASGEELYSGLEILPSVRVKMGNNDMPRNGTGLRSGDFDFRGKW